MVRVDISTGRKKHRPWAGVPTPAFCLTCSMILTAISFSTTLSTIYFSVSMVMPRIFLGFATEPRALSMVAPVEPTERAMSTTSEAKPAFTIIYNALSSFIGEYFEYGQERCHADARCQCYADGGFFDVTVGQLLDLVAKHCYRRLGHRDLDVVSGARKRYKMIITARGSEE